MPRRHPRRRFAKLEALSPNELEQRLGVRRGGRLAAWAWFGPAGYGGPGLEPPPPLLREPHGCDHPVGCVVAFFALCEPAIAGLVIVLLVLTAFVPSRAEYAKRRIRLRRGGAMVEAHSGGFAVRRPFRHPLPIRWDEVEEVERVPESGTIVLKTAHGWIYVGARDPTGSRLAAAAGLAIEAREAGVRLPGESAPGEPVSEAAISLVVDDEPNDRGISPAEDA